MVLCLTIAYKTVTASLLLKGKATKYLLNISKPVKMYELPCFEMGNDLYRSISQTSNCAVGVEFAVIPQLVGVRENFRFWQFWCFTLLFTLKTFLGKCNVLLFYEVYLGYHHALQAGSCDKGVEWYTKLTSDEFELITFIIWSPETLLSLAGFAQLEVNIIFCVLQFFGNLFQDFSETNWPFDSLTNAC